jgi:hypothetical protein
MIGNEVIRRFNLCNREKESGIRKIHP